MSTALAISAIAAVPALDLDALAARAAGLAEDARAPNTRRAYRSDWGHFAGWCAAQGLVALPATPATVGLYLAAHDTNLSVATLTRRLSAIAVAHRMAGFALDTRHPAIANLMKGLAIGTAAPSATPRPDDLPAPAGSRSPG